MSGRKNIDRSLKRMARKYAREAANALKNIRANRTAMSSEFVRSQVIDCQREVEHLISLIKEECRACGKKIPFGCSLCASCADEQGP